MAELPILPLKPFSLLTDTMHMSAEEMGAYCRLLFTMWLQGGKLRDDEGELHRISGLTLRRWRKLNRRILLPMTIANGQISQKRLTDTWLKVQELRAKRKIASRAGVAARQKNHMVDQVITNKNQNKNSLSYLEAERLARRRSFEEER